MDGIWCKFEEAFKIVEHMGDLKTVKKTINTVSDRLENFVDEKIDIIIEKARQFKQHRCI